MATPLYNAHQAPLQMPQGANLGLWYTRFFNQYTDDWQVNDASKQGWLNTVTPRAVQSKLPFEAASKRLRHLCTALDGALQEFATEWHFVTGLGLSHPVENGFTWHHTLGAPYLPASSVKGLLRAWVEVWMDDEAIAKIRTGTRQEMMSHWFGTAKGDSETEGVGSLLFFDALPTDVPQLSADVMTPHMGAWYEQGGSIASENISTVGCCVPNAS